MQGLSPIPPQNRGQIHIDEDRAAYRVINKNGFYDEWDQLWEKGSMIYWEGQPNSGFEPINDLAVDAMREYLVDLDTKAKEVAEKKGTGHASMVNAFDARQRLKELDKKTGRKVEEEEKVNLMGSRKDGHRMAQSVMDNQNFQTPLMGTSKKERARQERSHEKPSKGGKGFL